MSKPLFDRFRRFAVGSLALAGAAGLLLVAATAGTRPAPVQPDPAARIARGEYLVTVGGCEDCHTPWIVGPEGPGPDPSRTLSGHPHDFELEPSPLSAESSWGMMVAATNTAFAGPWGVSFAANLTPCTDSGLGPWTEEIFINTIRTGRHWGQSRPILPPMPWPNFRRMTDEDLGSIFAYLRSLPPRYNPVPQPLPPPGTEVASADPWN